MLDKGVIEALKEQENRMHVNDKLVLDTEDHKDILEIVSKMKSRLPVVLERDTG